MSRGGYRGGSTIIHASPGFVSMSQGKRVWTDGKTKKAKIKRTVAGFAGHMTIEEARRAGLTRQQWQKQANSHVLRIERQILASRQKLAQLTKELKLAERARQAAFQVSTLSGQKAPAKSEPSSAK